MKDMLSYAFIGDAVHTLFVREKVLANKELKMDTANRLASRFCKASHQAQVLDLICEGLNDEEKEIVRRTRNVKNKHKAKNTDILTYKKATCFEALVGFHYIEKNTQRLNFLLEKSIEGEN